MKKHKNTPLEAKNGPFDLHDPFKPPRDGDGPDPKPDNRFVKININTPQEGIKFLMPASGLTVIVSGTAWVSKFGDPSFKGKVISVSVRLGKNSKFQPASLSANGHNWIFSGLAEESDLENGQLKINVSAFGGLLKPGAAERTVFVTVDKTSPDLTITEPDDLIDPGPGAHSVEVKGTAIDKVSGVESVKLRLVPVIKAPFFAGGIFGWFDAENLSGDWSKWAATLNLSANGSHLYEVKATDKVGNVRKEGFNVALNNSFPVVTIDNQSPDTTTWTGKDMTYELSGGASDKHSGVKVVQWRISDAPYQAAENPNGDWSKWRAVVPMPEIGAYKINVRAIDNAGNMSIPKKLDVQAVEEFDREAPLGISSYLKDLLMFATQHVTEKESGPHISGELLKKTFHQPFDSLADPSFKVIAMRPVHRIRLCIEVLRKYLDSHEQDQPTEAEFKYRQAAYHTLLSNLGTSYEEIRLARSADKDTREALAERLGIDLSPTRPDQLDSLFLQPDHISEKALEQLFGIPDTVGDSLEPDIGDDFALLIWRKEELRKLWRHQDLVNRSNPEAPLPIIDPDLIRVHDLSDPAVGNVAFDLWTARKDWVTGKLEEIRKKSESSPNTLQGFETIIKPVLGPVKELQALAETRDKGIDIRPQLKEMKIDLQAFLYLMGIHKLVVSESSQGVELVLSSEWENVYSILVQVQKLRKFDDWRQEEENVSLTLSPDFFGIPDPNSSTAVSPIELPDWRATQQARDAWQNTLSARIGQSQTVEEALRTAISATEEATLPLLRRILIGAIGAKIGEEDIDLVTNELTNRLQMDMKSSGTRKTTRINQAIETLQGIFFGLRVGRFKKANPVLGPTPAADWSLMTPDGAFGKKAEERFDEEWEWMGAFATWRAAMFVFGYPENYLLPTLRKSDEKTKAFGNLADELSGTRSLTPEGARGAAQGYLDRLRELRKNQPDDLTDEEKNQLVDVFDKLDTLWDETHDDSNSSFEITEQLSNTDLEERRNLVTELFKKLVGKDVTNPHLASKYFKEIFYFVPVHIALQLQRSGQYLAALDWFQTVYAYNLPVGDRKIYYGLTLDKNLSQEISRHPDWLLVLNPHEIAEDRKNSYTRFTLLSLVRCLQEFADSEFTQGTNETIPRARSLYMTALNLQDLPEMQPPGSEKVATLFPPNPVLDALQRHAESNLFKIRNGCNIAGMERQVELESGSVDKLGRLSNMPRIGNDGQLIISRPINVQPTPYRYSTLIERAKQLVSIAEQIEAAFLAALEKRDAEAYNVLRAQQDIHLTDAVVQLQDLRVNEASAGVELVELQQGRARIRLEEFQRRISEGLNGYEKVMIRSYKEARDARLAMAESQVRGGLFSGFISAATFAFTGNPGAAINAISSFAGVATGNSKMDAITEDATSRIASVYASFERRKDEWQLQMSLAALDIAIGDQQITLAQDHRQVIGQERVIAGLQADYAKAEVDFLATKFTNVDLYEWMSTILGRVYSYFLQQAASIARLAQYQLAFERQASPPSFIQADYWHVSSEADGAASKGNGQTPDRRGLTGSARLLQDIYKLDQYAFETRKRKLQLSQTFSLAQLAPTEFQRFRKTGVLPFATPMELFDRGFPGHYLRLIRRVRTSIVALIPPIQGIRASLTASGLSRIVVGGGLFQNMVVRRNPEQIAFTSPSNATGLFELEPEGELLLPFESMGVDTAWELELPKAANPFDYNTLADVLITIEYTALHSTAYRHQVTQQLNRSLSAERSFSFRQEFADAWYDLHNPDQAETPMMVRFKTRREDFPPNIEDLEIQQVLLYFAHADEVGFEVEVEHLWFTNEESTVTVGGAATSMKDGVISTRRANGSAWIPLIGKAPAGTWELKLPNTEKVRNWFKEEKIEDILLVLTFEGRTPAWPEYN